ncbi:glycoside hydrolase family 3 protein [Phlebopus sp. FC_14]|nr:glycoside hydrolase family 3 protein [Phlebopus sp. FC_14]
MVSRKLSALLCLLPMVLGAPSATTSTNSSSVAPSPTFATSSSVSSGTSTIPFISLSSNFTSLLTTSSSPATTTGNGVKSIPLSSYPFTPYPTPTLPARPPVFPETDPLSPPEVSNDSQVVPDFAPAWATAYQKAEQLISNYSVEEKVNITTGVGWMNGLCVGNIPSVRTFPGLCLEDAPLGVRYTDYSTAFPAGIQTASTWNRELIRARGLAMGQEFKGKGVNVALGPMMNMGRVAAGGRNFEGFGADPFLTGEAAYETILGLQQAGVQATAKHFVGNEQEHFRTSSSSNIDDRTMHEIYAHPFLRSVMAGVASVMCSYNLVNNTYACDNDKIMDDILKREFGFQGFVQSDWGATMSTLGAVAGLDMTMPGDITLGSGTSYFGSNLTDYVDEGYISTKRLDDMATRIVAAWYYLHQDSAYPQVNFNAFDPYDEVNNKHVDVQGDHYKLVRDVGAQGTVLLKNANGALPLHKPRNMVLIGSDARPGLSGPNEFTDQGGSDGILAMGWGSGTANFPYLISPMEAIQERARQDGSSIFYDFDDFNVEQAGTYAIGQAVALVFISADSGEDYLTVDGNQGDRNNLTAWHNGDNLVQAVAAQNNNTIVVVNSVGPLILEPWIENPNVTAVVWAGIQGQEAGNSIVDILYGNYNPSGRLPYTIAKDPADYPTQVIYNGSNNEIVQIDYSEGLFIDYRHFDAANIQPRFEFGFGLSYTTFNYSDLRVETIPSQDNAQQDLITAWENGQASPIAEGSSTALWLHEPAFKITFNVSNTGSCSGTEIPQLYIHHPSDAGEPPSVLKGFTNVQIDSGKTRSASITLSRHDVSIWDVVAQGWLKPRGQITFSVGASSRAFRLQGAIPA